MNKYKISSLQISNVTETRSKTVNQSKAVVRVKGKRQDGAISSEEWDELITVLCAIVARVSFYHHL